MWTDDQLHMLIDERKNSNEFYHDLVGRLKKSFWKMVAGNINLKFDTKYSEQQAKEKF